MTQAGLSQAGVAAPRHPWPQGSGWGGIWDKTGSVWEKGCGGEGGGGVVRPVLVCAGSASLRHSPEPPHSHAAECIFPLQVQKFRHFQGLLSWAHSCLSPREGSPVFGVREAMAPAQNPSGRCPGSQNPSWSSRGAAELAVLGPAVTGQSRHGPGRGVSGIPAAMFSFFHLFLHRARQQGLTPRPASPPGVSRCHFSELL